MTPDQLSRRVAEIFGWEYLPGHDALMVTAQWYRIVSDTEEHQREGKDPPPYASPGEWVLFGEMVSFLSNDWQVVHFSHTKKKSNVCILDWAYDLVCQRDGQSLNEAAARCVVAIEGKDDGRTNPR